MDVKVIEMATAEWLESMSGGAFVAGEYVDSESWLAARHDMIGSSEAASVIGRSPYKNEAELWEEKIGMDIPAESRSEENEDMARGHASEPLLLALYKAETGDDVRWGDKIILKSCTRKFMSATLDGIGIDKSDGSPYVIEVKSISRNRDEWSDYTVPPHYYLQVLHQLSVTRWKRAIILARFCRTDWGIDGAYERSYHFEYDKLESEIAALERAEDRFWNQYVIGGNRPPVRVPEI